MQNSGQPAVDAPVGRQALWREILPVTGEWVTVSHDFLSVFLQNVVKMKNSRRTGLPGTVLA
jgi:hypothetical protein